MEFLIGGLSGALAVCVTNPLEVVKCRFQLQGELKARGQYSVHYRNILHAFYTIAKNDGFFALQKGLPPSIGYQLVLNGTRLGLFQIAEERQWIAKRGSKDEVGNTSIFRSMAVSWAGGCVGGFMSTPFNLVKIQLQAKANESIAVGYQHRHSGTIPAFIDIYSHHGIKGLWRGASAIIFRISVASCTQIPTFTQLKQYLKTHEVFPNPGGMLDTVTAAFGGGVVTALVITPFDVVTTRFCNQGVDANGKGLLYKNGLDCMIKTVKKEGVYGMYKGLLPCYFRIGPYALLTMVIWDSLKSLQKKYTAS